MNSLDQDLELLRQLNEHRYKAKELREQALDPLKSIESIEWKNRKVNSTKKPGKVEIDFSRWVSSNNPVETALVVKIQNHQDLSEHEDENNSSNAEIRLGCVDIST